MKLKKYRVEEIANLKYGKMPKKSDIVGDGYPIFSGYRIVGYHREYLYDDPVLIVIARGVGGTGKVKISPPKCFLTNLAIAFDVDSRVADRDYLFYYFQLHDLRELDSGSAQSQITTGVLSKYEVSLPQLAIQKKISAILLAFDEAIRINDRKIKCLEEMAELLYREWFVNFKFPGHQKVKMVDSGHPDFGMIPEGWGVGKISELVSLKSGYAFKSSDFSDQGFYKLVTIKNVQDGYFLPECSNALLGVPTNMPEYCELIRGDMLMSLTGNVARVCQVFGRHKYLLNQRVAKVVPKVCSHSSYVYCLVSSYVVQEQLKNLANGVAQANLSPVQAVNLKVVLPLKTMIEKFSKITAPILDLQNVLRESNETLGSLRDLLLPKLISGEIDVSGISADRETESILSKNTKKENSERTRI